MGVFDGRLAFDQVPLGTVLGGQAQGLVSVESDPWSCESPCYRVDGPQLIVALHGRELEVRP